MANSTIHGNRSTPHSAPDGVSGRAGRDLASGERVNGLGDLYWLADQLGVSYDQARRRCLAGQVPYLKLGARIYVPKIALDHIINRALDAFDSGNSDAS